MRRARALGALIGLVLAAASAYPAGEGALSGTVRDATTGLPLAHVFVDVFNSNGVWMTNGETAPGGGYAIGGLPAGSYHARTDLSWLGYLDELFDDVACPFQECTVTSGTSILVTAGATTTGIDFSVTPGGRISGTVRDASTGLPLTNVSVSVYDAGGSRRTYGSTDGSGVYTTSAELPSGSYYARTSNRQGYFDEVYADISCPSESCFVPSGTPIAVTAGTTTPAIDFALAPGGRIGATVTDAVTGLSVAGVGLLIFDWSGGSVTTGTTDASGVFVTGEGLRPGTYYARTYESRGYIDELYDDIPCTGGSCTETHGAPIVVRAGETTGIGFALRPGGRISGTVTLGSPDPPPYDYRLPVRIYDASGRKVASVWTGTIGPYTIEGLDSGIYYAVALASQGYVAELYGDIPCPDGECTVTSGTPIAVTAGATTAGVDFELTRGGRVSGTVTDAGTGLPLALVDVTLYDSEGRYVEHDYTDDAGVYETDSSLASGTYHARIPTAQGYLGELFDDIPCPAESCTVTRGTAIGVTAGTTTSGIDFGLVRGGSISGVLTVAATGLPVSGAWVSVGDSSGRLVTSAETDAAGTYTTSKPLPSGTYYAWASNVPGYLAELFDDIPCAGPSCTATAGTPIAVTAGATTTGIDFALGPGGRITGTVTDAATGLPLAPVRVAIYDGDLRAVATGAADSSGVYTIEGGLSSGTYYARTENSLGYVDELYHDVPCPACPVGRGTPISVTAGTTTSGIDFGLRPKGRISGTVKDAATGLPLAGVRVSVVGSTGLPVTSASTDGAGAWATGVSLAPGTYYARTWSSAGYVDEVYDDIACPQTTCPEENGRPIVVAAGTTTTGIDFGLVRGGRIGGTVKDAATGLPLAYVEVRIYTAAGSQVATTLTNALGDWATHGRHGVWGTYGGPGLVSGTYYARTSNSLGYVDEFYGDIPCPGEACPVTAGTPISVVAGATTGGIDFGLARGGRLAGIVTDAATGLPLKGVQVSIHDSGGTCVAGRTTDFWGVFTSVDALASGTYYARTSNALGYTDELYDEAPCPGGVCAVTIGTPITVAAGAPAATIVFSLSAGGRISGAVTDAGTGLPLAGVRVRIHDAIGRPVASGTTDASGAWATLSGLPSGTYYARTDVAPGHVDELYEDIPCPLGVCTVTSGTPIHVTAGATTAGVDFGLDPSPASSFYTVVPCRVLDTRNPDGPLGGPALVAGAERPFALAGACGIPATAKAVSANVTVTEPTHAGNVRLYPAGAPAPPTSTVNYTPGVTRAGNATVPLNASGQVTVLASPSGTVHLVLDVNGYYE
jgi:hypothetical protein